MDGSLYREDKVGTAASNVTSNINWHSLLTCFRIIVLTTQLHLFTLLAPAAREDNAELRPREPDTGANNDGEQEEEVAAPEEDTEGNGMEGNETDGPDQAPEVGKTGCGGA